VIRHYGAAAIVHASVSELPRSRRTTFFHAPPSFSEGKASVDGAAEEGTPFIPGKRLRHMMTLKEGWSE